MDIARWRRLFALTGMTDDELDDFLQQANDQIADAIEDAYPPVVVSARLELARWDAGDIDTTGW